MSDTRLPLRKWFDNFVGSEEEREVADALLAVVETADKACRGTAGDGTIRALGDALRALDGVVR